MRAHGSALHLGRAALATFLTLDWRYDPNGIRAAVELAVEASASSAAASASGDVVIG